MSSHNNPPRLRALLVTLLSFTLFIGTSVPAFAQHTAAEVTDRLQGLDAQMEKVLKADIRPSQELNLEELKRTERVGKAKSAKL